MSAETIIGALEVLRLGTAFLANRENMDVNEAVGLLVSGNLAAFGLTGEVLQTAQLGRAALTYLNGRGIFIDDALALIEDAQAESRDVTTEEVQAHLNTTQSELDETQADINALRDSE